MGIFDKRRSVPAKELRSMLKKDTGRIPGTFGKSYNRIAREKIGQSIFGTKYGSDISKDDYRSAIRKLESSSRQSKNPLDRVKTKQTINYLKGMGGKKL